MNPIKHLDATLHASLAPPYSHASSPPPPLPLILLPDSRVLVSATAAKMHNHAPTSWLLDLPLEILHLILLHLSSSDIQRFAHTCRTARLCVHGPAGTGDAHFWCRIFRRDWDPQPLAADVAADAQHATLSQPLRLIRQRTAAKRTLQAASTDPRRTIANYDAALAAVLGVAEHRPDRRAHPMHAPCSNVEWLNAVASAKAQGDAWGRCIFPRQQLEHYASWKQAISMYPELYAHFATPAPAAAKRRKMDKLAAHSFGDAKPTLPPTAAGASSAASTASPGAAAAEERLSPRRSLRLLKRVVPECLQPLIQDRSFHDLPEPNTQLAARVHCLHGPTQVAKRVDATARAAARRKVYDSGWTGWENGYGPFHFYRHRALAEQAAAADASDDESTDSAATTDSEDVNPDPVPIYLEDSDDELATDTRDADDGHHVALQRLPAGNGLDEDDGAVADEGVEAVAAADPSEGQEGSVVRGDAGITIITLDDDDDNDDDNDDDDDFDLDGFLDPTGLRELLRDGLLRHHAGSYVQEQAAAYHRKILAQRWEEQADGGDQGETEPSQVLRSKRIDWKMVEAIMTVMHANIQEARPLRWGHDLQLPKVVGPTGMVEHDPMQDRSFLNIPSGWTVSTGEPISAVPHDSSSAKPRDWAHVEGFWGGTYAFLDYSIFISSNAGFAQHKAARQKWASALAGRTSDQSTGERALPQLPCLAGLSDAKCRCELCCFLPSLRNAEEAIGDLLELHLELLPLSEQPTAERTEDGEDEDPDYPTLHFRGTTVVSHPNFATRPRGSCNGSVRPIFSPPAGPAELQGTKRKRRQIEGIHWSFVHGYDGEDRWQSEAVQPGPPGTRAPMYAIWSDANHERNSPNGPAVYWRMDERPWKQVDALVAEENRVRVQQQQRREAGA
ncbi:hypothetical protein ACQY0O_006190 [Thecaphora frezii]